MVKIYPEGHIDTKYYFQTYQRVVEGLKKNKELHTRNKELIEQFIHDARLGKTILKGQKKKIGNKRIVKYIQDLKKLDKWLGKPFDKVSEQDMERFIVNLEDNHILSNRNKPFAPETKVAIKKIIKKFYKWLRGENKHYPKIVEWIDTSVEIQDYKAITKEQVDALLVRITSTTPEKLIRNRALIMVLFDSGARADELLNIRLKHLTFENGNYKLRIEFSKTKKRTVLLPLCRKYLDEWLDVHPARDEPLAQLFPMKYNYLRVLVGRMGKQINLKKFSPHSLRHSSATYWAKTMSQYQLCYRFGWSMNSKQPARYIDREGLDQEKTAEVVKAANMEKLEQENTELNKRLALLEEQMERVLKEDKDELLQIIQMIKQKNNFILH